ncbi:DUF596 domain-containing protein [Cupriavidus sp. 8B]
MTEERINEIARLCETMAIDSLWLYTSEEANYEQKKSEFVQIVGYLVRAARVRLAKNGEFLSGSIDDQLESLENALPKAGTPEALALESDGLAGGVWFYSDACPAGIVWVMRNDQGDEWFEWT